jgi:diguanylate cyclase (GGDEF)-like protein
MNIAAASEGEGFWARVRAALVRRADEPEPAYGRPAIAKPHVGRIRPSQLVDEQLRHGWAIASAANVSLCVMALELDLHTDYLTAYGREAVDDTLRTLHDAIGTAIARPADCCVRSGRSGFVLILPDMPVTMARDLAGRIAVAVRRCDLPNRQSHAGQVTLSVGLVAINPHGNYDRAVLGHAAQAVKKAQRRGIGRLEVLDLRGKPDKRKKAA